MIDEKINKSLKEIEHELQNISSARSQVDKTVSSYGELNKSVSLYINSVNSLNKNVQDLVETVKNDYTTKSLELDKHQKEIKELTISTLNEIKNSAEQVKISINNIIVSYRKRLSLCVILNIITIATIIILHLIK